MLETLRATVATRRQRPPEITVNKEPQQPQQDQQDDYPVNIDILSIGSQRQSEQQEAQVETMGMYRAVRHFYRATKRDDVVALSSSS